MIHRAAAPALLGISVASLAACGASDRVDRHDLEAQIAAFVHRRTGADVSVRCPDGVHARSGTVVRCTTTLSGDPMVVELRFAQGGHFRITQMRLL